MGRRWTPALVLAAGCFNSVPSAEPRPEPTLHSSFEAVSTGVSMSHTETSSSSTRLPSIEMELEAGRVVTFSVGQLLPNGGVLTAVYGDGTIDYFAQGAIYRSDPQGRQSLVDGLEVSKRRAIRWHRLPKSVKASIERAAQELSDPDEETRVSAEVYLINFGPRAAPYLIDRLGRESAAVVVPVLERITGLSFGSVSTPETIAKWRAWGGKP